MDLLIDSNVILDRILKRQPFFESAKNVFKLSKKADINLKMSASSVTDVYYIAYRTLKDRTQVRALLADVLNVVKIVSVTEENIHYAFNLDWKDFEDAVQYSVALSNGIDAIITRNMKGFSQAEVKICTPEEIINFIDTKEN